MFTLPQSRPSGQLRFDSTCAHKSQWILGSRLPKRTFSCHSASPSTETSTVAPVQASSVQINSVLYQGGAYSVEGSLTSECPPEIVYSILTDYKSLPRIFHNIEDCTIRFNGDEKHLIQTCSWAFLVFHGTFATELIVEEDAESGRLAFSLLRSAFMKQFIGSWHVEPGSNGKGSSIRHALAVKPVLAPPQKIGDLTKNIFVSQVESILKDLARELEQHEQQRQQQQQN